MLAARSAGKIRVGVSGRAAALGGELQQHLVYAAAFGLYRNKGQCCNPLLHPLFKIGQGAPAPKKLEGQLLCHWL